MEVGIIPKACVCSEASAFERRASPFKPVAAVTATRLTRRGSMALTFELSAGT
jgi:hypothetical protein